MTLVLMDGFDAYNGTGANTGVQSKWTLFQTTGLSMQTGRFSGQCVQFSTSTGGTYGPGYRDLPSSYSAGTVAFALRQTVRMDAGNDGSVFPFCEVLNGTTYQLGLKIKNDGTLQAYRLTAINAGTLLGSSPAGVIALNTWHYIEWSFSIHDSTGTITVKVDGTAVLTLTGQDTNNSGGTFSRVQFAGYQAPGTIGTFQIDDVYVLDTTTSLGERRIETLYPSGDVAQGFTRSSGSTNYTLVDEAQANGDTDYVQASAVNDTDTYDFGNLSSTPTTIDAVQMIAFSRKTDAYSRSIALQIKSGATTSDGANFPLPSDYAKQERLTLVDPNTSAAWAAAAVNAMTGGPKVTV